MLFRSHNYDIVEGPMADDTVWNYVNDFLTGRISRKQFWINLFHSSDIQRWLRGLKYKSLTNYRGIKRG